MTKPRSRAAKPGREVVYLPPDAMVLAMMLGTYESDRYILRNISELREIKRTTRRKGKR